MERRLVVTVAGTIVVALGSVGAVVGPGLVTELRHPRDVDAYYSHLQSGGMQGWDDSGKPSPRNAASAALQGHAGAALAEGDRACAWLLTQPDAPGTDPSGRSRVSEVATRYVASTPFPEVELSTEARQYIVTRAWTDLCWRDKHAKTSPQGGGGAPSAYPASTGSQSSQVAVPASPS